MLFLKGGQLKSPAVSTSVAASKQGRCKVDGKADGKRNLKQQFLRNISLKNKKEKRDRKTCKRQRASKEEIVLHCFEKVLW